MITYTQASIDRSLPPYVFAHWAVYLLSVSVSIADKNAVLEGVIRWLLPKSSKASYTLQPKFVSLSCTLNSIVEHPPLSTFGVVVTAAKWEHVIDNPNKYAALLLSNACSSCSKDDIRSFTIPVPVIRLDYVEKHAPRHKVTADPTVYIDSALQQLCDLPDIYMGVTPNLLLHVIRCRSSLPLPHAQEFYALKDNRPSVPMLASRSINTYACHRCQQYKRRKSGCVDCTVVNGGISLSCMENISGQKRLRKQPNTEKIFIPSNQVFVPLVANRYKSDCTSQGSVCNYNTNLLLTKVGIVNYIDLKGSVTVPIYPDMKTLEFVSQTEKKIPKDCQGIAFVIHALMHGHYSENIGIPTFI